MKPSHYLEANRENIRRAAQKFNLQNPRVFGSVADGTDNENSDIDILVFAPKGTNLFDLSGFMVELESIIPFPIHIHTEKSIPVAYRQSILAEARPI
ncbi:MAG: nucleotidyltransferase domain-containing protein [Candidatus Symbiobacter sp.]|nr:nucleotidyltransferase domain-containing protein [Candidatus Symbiobacter sp.]